MRILYVDFNTVGHHSVYYKTISSIKSVDPVLALPKRADLKDVKQYEIPGLSRNMGFSQYKQVIKEINNIIEIEKPDIVHMLSGDMLYKFFGWQLSRIKAPRVVTFHHMEFSFFKRISYKCIFKKINLGITHTNFIHEQLKELGILNVYHIEYPFLEEIKSYDKQLLKKQFSIPQNCKILLAFGETRYDKGLDILLRALANITEPFHLIVAGKPTEITRDDIECLTESYSNKTTLMLAYIDDETMCKLFEMCDMVVLPYRRKFAGASGPLTTAVAYEKMLIGPNENSIGNIITNFHLGEVFECEMQESLENCIRTSLLSEFNYDDLAKEYQKIISKEKFVEKYKNVYMSRRVEL